MSFDVTKVCTKCGAEKMVTEFGSDKRRKDGMRSWCRACDREYDKAGRDKLKRAERRENDSDYAKGYRESHRDGRKQYDERYWAKHPERRAAKQAVQNALRAGTLTSEPCGADGVHEGRVEAHHDDYGRPLEVRWLCVKHHKEWHHGLWAKYQMEKARADDLATTLQGTLTSLAAASEENDQWEVEIALVMRERNEAEAMLRMAWERYGQHRYSRPEGFIEELAADLCRRTEAKP